MKARILYDGHNKGWAIELECETEAEGALLFELVRSQDAVSLLPRTCDVHDPEAMKAGMRVFRIERKDWSKVFTVGEEKPSGHYM